MASRRASLQRVGTLVCAVVFLGGCAFWPAPGQDRPPESVVEIRSYDSQQLLEDLQALTRAYPEGLRVQEIGDSVAGSPIRALRLGSGERRVLAVGGHHAREWVTSWLLMRMAEELGSHGAESASGVRGKAAGSGVIP